MSHLHMPAKNMTKQNKTSGSSQSIRVMLKCIEMTGQLLKLADISIVLIQLNASSLKTIQSGKCVSSVFQSLESLGLKAKLYVTDDQITLVFQTHDPSRASCKSVNKRMFSS